jgi:hypothetical protein
MTLANASRPEALDRSSQQRDEALRLAVVVVPGAPRAQL